MATDFQHPDTDKPEPEEPLGAGFDFTDPSSPLAAVYLYNVHLVVLLLLLGVFLLLNFVPLWHTDIWGHLKFGQYLVEQGAIPPGEPFTPYGEAESNLMSYCWLGQASLYLVFRAGQWLAGGAELQQLAGGVDLLRLCHATLVLLRCLVLLLAFQRLTRSWRLALVGLSLTILLGSGHLAVLRPQVLGELLFALLLLALSRPVLSNRSLIVLPLLLVFWANWHGSFVTGLVLLAVAIAGRVFAVLLSGPEQRWQAFWQDQQARRLLLVLLSSTVLVGLFNPAGPWIYANTLELMRHPNIRTLDEWQPLTWTLAPGPQYAYTFTLVLLVGAPLLARRSYPLEFLLWIVLYGMQPFLHQRMLVWWFVLMPWLLLTLWREGPAPGWTVSQSIPSLRKTLVALALVVVAVLWAIPGQWVLAGGPTPLQRSLSGATPWQFARQLQHPLDHSAAWLPQLEPWLRHHARAGVFRGRVLASERLGEYLLWALPAETPVLLYTHVHILPEPFWQDCLTMRNARPGWRTLLDRYQVEVVVVEAEEHQPLRLELARDPSWAIVFDETSSEKKRDQRTRLLVAVRKARL